MRKGDPEFELTCSVLPFSPIIGDDSPPDPATHCEVFLEITGKLIECLSAALLERDDVWKSLRIVAQAERLMGEYTSEGFYLLLPMQRDLQFTLHMAWRMARRQFIKHALLCPPNQTETYVRHFRELGWRGGEAVADFRAVEAALARGESIFDDLRRKVG
jgi:hypothetical protein